MSTEHSADTMPPIVGEQFCLLCKHHEQLNSRTFDRQQHPSRPHNADLVVGSVCRIGQLQPGQKEDRLERLHSSWKRIAACEPQELAVVADSLADQRQLDGCTR